MQIRIILIILHAYKVLKAKDYSAPSLEQAHPLQPNFG
jgi:hypothetical protein